MMIPPYLPLGGQQRAALSVAHGRIVWRKIRVHELQLPPIGARAAVDPVGLYVFQLFSRVDVYLFVVEENVLLEALSKVLVKNKKVKEGAREGGQGENHSETERQTDGGRRDFD